MIASSWVMSAAMCSRASASTTDNSVSSRSRASGVRRSCEMPASITARSCSILASCSAMRLKPMLTSRISLVTTPDLLPKIGLGIRLHLLEDHGGDLWWRIVLASDLNASIAIAGPNHLVWHQLDLLPDLLMPSTHEAFDRKDRVFRVGGCLPLGDLTDQSLPLFREGHD